MRLIEDLGFEWTASGEGVLRHSLAAAEASPDPHPWSRPYQPPGRSIWCWFRHDRLSDTIGFDFATWHADDAVANLVHHLERIRASLDHPDRHVVPIIMDGENAWEHYPENAYYFLSALYRRLVETPGLRLVTMSECRREGIEARPLPRLVAGSWVYGTLSTWIGSPAKNRGWELLIEARAALQQVEGAGRLSAHRIERARQQLAACEGSDWFWWLGDERAPESIESFDALFRRHLANLYDLIDRPAPAQLLATPLHAPSGEAAAGTMRRSGL
jgi:alpha-amylase/alpha-mannosidase (GH57 family)